MAQPPGAVVFPRYRDNAIRDTEYLAIAKATLLVPPGVRDYDGFITHMLQCHSGGFIDELESLGRAA